MKRRILSLLITLVMLATMLPTAALAANNEGIWDRESVQTHIDYGDGLHADYAVSGTYQLGTGTAVWDLNTYTLTLNSAVYTASASSFDAIRLPSADCTLVLNGNSILNSSYRGISLPDGASLTIKGEGRLDINLDNQYTATRDTKYGIGAFAMSGSGEGDYDSDIIFEGGTTAIHLGTDSVGVATMKGKILVKGGSLAVDTMENTTITEIDGLYARKNIVHISDGDVNVSVPGTAIQGAAVHISGGTVNAVGTTTGNLSYGIVAREDLNTIDYSMAETDILEEGGSFQSLIITGGTVKAEGRIGLYSTDTVFFYGGDVTAISNNVQGDYSQGINPGFPIKTSAYPQCDRHKGCTAENHIYIPDSSTKIPADVEAYGERFSPNGTYVQLPDGTVPDEVKIQGAENPVLYMLRLIDTAPSAVSYGMPPNFSCYYMEGMTVPVYAGTKGKDLLFSQWTSEPAVELTPVSGTDNVGAATFVMPASDVTITANWGDTPPAQTYTVTIEDLGTLPAGVSSGAGDYEEGATVTLNAGTREDHKFNCWYSPNGSVSIKNSMSASGATFTMPAKAVTVTALWLSTAPTYAVTVNGSAVKFTPAEPTSGAGNYGAGSTVTIYAGNKADDTFLGWTVDSGGVTIDDPTKANGATFIMPANPVTVTAQWASEAPHTVTVKDVGTLPEGKTSGAGSYKAGTYVELNAGTREGYTFNTWRAEDEKVTILLSDGSNGAYFYMPAEDVVLTAQWAPVTYRVSVSSSYAGLDASGEGSYSEGETVTLDAGTWEGHTFTGWTVHTNNVTIDDPLKASGATFTMPAETVSVTATWAAAPFTNSVTVNGSYAASSGRGNYAQGDTVTLDAGTREGYSFSGWTVTGGTIMLANANSARTTFTMPGRDVTLLANWTPVSDTSGAITLYLDELPGPLTIDEQGYRCGEPNNTQHSFSGPYILTQRDSSTATSNTVTVAKRYNELEFAVTLKGVNIASADRAALLVDNDAKLTLTLQGSNTLRGGANHAGLELTATNRIPETAVTINGTASDSLTATGGDYGAGIGGAGPVHYNSITINGGVITATGGKGAAGIGSGNTYGNGGTGAGGIGSVIINGGTVTAKGTADSGTTATDLLGAAGIGAGYGKASYPDGPDSTIIITGGDVTATGVGKAPAIGGTYTGRIYISGGTVTTHRGDSQSTAEIGKHPDASGGICDVHFCEQYDTNTGNAQIFVSGPNAISNKPTAPTGTANYYWNAIVYEGNSGQLYCNYYNKTQTMELDALTVPAGNTLNIPRGVTLKLPQSGLHSSGARFSGKGRVILDETYHYAKADGALAPCEAELIGSSGTSGIFNTLKDIITGTIANDGVNSWLVYSGNKILLLADVDYPDDIDLDGTRCSEVEIDLNGKTLSLGGHTILAEVESFTAAENNVFTISDSSPDGSGKITGSSTGPLVRNTTGRLVITGGTLENSGTGPAMQIENPSEVELSGGSFSRLVVTANTGFTPAPLASLLSDGTALYDSENKLWISPVSKKPELSSVSIQAAPAGLLPVAVEHEASSSIASISGLATSGGASYQWLARSDQDGSASPVQGANTATLSLNNGTLEAGNWYVSCRVTAGGVTMLTDEAYVEATEPDVIATLAEGTYTYDGTAHEPAVSVKTKDNVVLTVGTDYSLTYEDNVNAGTAKVTVSGTQENPFDPIVLTFQISPTALTIQSKDQTVTGSGAPQSGTDWAQTTGLISGDHLSALTLAQNEARTQIVASGASIQNAAGEDVTDCYSITYLPGTLTVSGGGSSTGSGNDPGTGSGGSSSSSSGGSSSSGSGGGSSSGSGDSSSGGSSGSTVVKNEDGSTTTTQKNSQTGAVTETTKHPDGSTTVVNTQRDGTVTTTETDRQGNRTETVERPDGSSSITAKTQDGTTAQAEISTSGQVTASVSLSAEAAAQESAALLPLPALQARQNVEQAPSVTIETQAEGPVRVEVPVSNVTPGTVAMLVHPDGSMEVLKQTVPGETGVVFTVEDGATVKIVDNGRQFDDVAETNWAAPAVEFVTGRELFTGVSETDFAPEQPMTRGMLMTVLARFDGQDTSGGSTWYESGVNWAKSNNISDGTQPTANISREQLVVMLYRYAGSPSASDMDLPFPDTGDISDYARTAVNWAVSNGIVKGTDSGIFDPNGPATRAQTAQILENYIKLLDGKSGIKRG